MHILTITTPVGICLLVLTFEVRVAYSVGILYPRESETREVLNLDGLWKFSVSPKNDSELGFKDRWYASYHDQWMDMPVPSSFNDVTVCKYIRDFVGWSWYQRQFFVPKLWQGIRRVFLRFGSVNYAAHVWINGKLSMMHFGGHLPFQADVTDLVDFGVINLVTVAVNNTLTNETIPQGTVTHINNTKMYPSDFTTYSYTFDFYNYAGIHRPVVLYSTPYTYIDDITVQTQVNNSKGTVEFSVSVHANESYNSQTVFCKVKLLEGSLRRGKTVRSCNGSIEILNGKLWWPVHMSSTPGFLYTLEVSIATSDGSGDVYRLPVGIRTVKWDNNSLKINDEPCYLRGFGKHEDSHIRGKGLDYVLLVRDYNLIHWIGANAYRTSHYPYSEEALDLADKQGILIIAESPAVNLDYFGDELLEKHKLIMQEMIQRDKNRPSVIMWSLSNEARTSRKAAGPYYKKLVQFVKSLDSRPITFVTNQKYTTDQAAQYVDIIGVNRYFAWYSDTGLLELIPQQIEEEFTSWYNTFKKPIFISEYGADAITGFHTLPSAAWSEDYQAQLLNQHFQAFDILRKKEYFIGELLWNFADFATKESVTRALGNHKGIFTRDRQPKAAAYFLKSRYSALASEEMGVNN